jgi:hypothetical protein
MGSRVRANESSMGETLQGNAPISADGVVSGCREQLKGRSVSYNEDNSIEPFLRRCAAQIQPGGSELNDITIILFVLLKTDLSDTVDRLPAAGTNHLS